MELKKINAIAFEEVIYDNEEKCLVVFTRNNCPICKQVLPRLKRIGDDYQDRFEFYLVDVEEAMDLFRRFPLKGVPSLLFFSDGEYQGKLVGNLDEEKITDKIEKILQTG